jgi:hypothetical protein
MRLAANCRTAQSGSHKAMIDTSRKQQSASNGNLAVRKPEKFTAVTGTS